KNTTKEFNLKKHHCISSETYDFTGPVRLSNIHPSYGQPNIPRGPEKTPSRVDDDGNKRQPEGSYPISKTSLQLSGPGDHFVYDVKAPNVPERYIFINITKYVYVQRDTNLGWRNLSEEARQFLTGSLSTTIIPFFYTLVCLLSVPINICALLVFIKRIKPKNPAVIYMMNLACADLLFSMVLPFKISYHFMGNDWIFGRAMCRIVTAAFYWNMYCSVLLISLISVDRLLAVVYPIQSLLWRTPAKAVIACAAMWMFSFVGSIHLLFTEQTFNLTELNITTCHDIQPSQPFRCYKMYYITFCFLLFFLPLIITMVSYTRVILTLSKVQPEVPDHSQKKRRAVFLTATVLVMFVLCFLPTNIVYIVHQLMYSEETEDQEKEMNPDRLYVIYLVCLCLGSLSCILDPLVYYFGSSQFQKGLSSMMGCQKTKQRTNGGQSSSSSPSNTSRSTSQITVKSNRKEIAERTLINRDSSQGNLCSQCKKQAV
ncbi:proteinase-activated receptor 1-like, partial [Cheilinus undulatus]|uniref:proteinase-activated receptor 1-like n=1 Tax=Cheilinus undulatus TaxID=241271 RepID=UPI001BD33B91